jgi:peptidoglycan/LPS O-acetylase OafA/YrhL
MKRIPTLDGWRGLAIALVLFDHAQGALLGGHLRPWLWTGHHGVTIFFVLSGFLITSKLIEGPGDLTRFYIRRLFRLMPVAWAYLAACLLYELAVGHCIVPGSEIVSCLLFYRNYYPPHQTFFAGHYWSLSVEEQFYLIWPCLMFFAGIQRAKWVAICGALACSIYRTLNYSYYDRQWFSFRTEVRADALLVGCLLALLLAKPSFRAAATRWSRLWALPAILVVLVCIAQFHWLPPLCECVALAALIATSVLHPRSVFARALSFKALTWLGTFSYSVYVWQQFFFAHRGNVDATIDIMCMMPLFALASYYWIERPFTRLGHRLTSKASQQPEGQRAGLSLDSPVDDGIEAPLVMIQS